MQAQDDDESSIIEVKMEVMAGRQEKFGPQNCAAAANRYVYHVPLRDRLFAYLVSNYAFKQPPHSSLGSVEAFKFLLANPEYAQFFPQPAENYWNTRFKDGQVAVYCDTSWRNFNLIWMNYEDEDCGCINAKDEVFFFENVVAGWNTFGLGIRVIASKFEVDYNTKDVWFSEEKPLLLLLHDFYYHPFCLFCTLNELSKSHNVIVPYLHDVVHLTSRYSEGNNLQIMCDKICDVIDLLVHNYNPNSGRVISVLAHGAACYIGVAVSNAVRCERLTLLNPIGVILPKPSASRCVSSSQEASKQARNCENEFSYSAESNTGVIVGVLPQSSSNREEIAQERSGTAIKLTYIKRRSYSSKARSDSSNYHFQQSNSYKSYDDFRTRQKSFSLANYRFSNASAVLTLDEYYSYKQHSNCSFGTGDDICDVFSIINECITDFYSRRDICQEILELTGAPCTAALKVCRNIFSVPKWPLKTARAEFLCYLPGLCLLSGLNVLKYYSDYVYFLDKQFFNAIKCMSRWVFDSVVLRYERTTILVSSHGCLLNSDAIRRLLDIDEQSCLVYCRTILGTGHDLFETALEIIKGLV